MAKDLSRFDLPARNESKNGLMGYFHLHSSELPLYMQKCSKTHDLFFGGS
jgi:hypothetical protein